MYFVNECWTFSIVGKHILIDRVTTTVRHNPAGIVPEIKKSVVLVAMVLNAHSNSSNLLKPIVCSYSEHRGRSCIVSHVNLDILGSLAYNSFRWRAIHLFNAMPKYI